MVPEGHHLELEMWEQGLVTNAWSHWDQPLVCPPHQLGLWLLLLLLLLLSLLG